MNQYQLEVVNELCNIACDDVERLLGELGVNYSRQGKKYAGPCPVHGGNNVSAFNFYPDGEYMRGNWICRSHRCQETWKKNLVGLIRGIKSRELNREFKWKEAVDWLVEFVGIKSLNSIQPPTPEQIAKRKAANIVRKLNVGPQQRTSGWSKEYVRKSLQVPAQYYIDRGYSPTILSKYDVGFYAPQNRVTVPVYDDDYRFCVGFSARSLYPRCDKCDMNLYHDPLLPCPLPSEKHLHSKWRNSANFEARHYLYNNWFAKRHIAESGAAILLEGPGEVWRLEENDIHISLAMFGVDLTEEQRVILDRSGALSLIVLLNNDEAGIKAALDLKEKLGRTYRLFFPTIQSNDVGDLHSDAITTDILPFVEKAKLLGVSK